MKRIILFFIALTAISANSMAQTEKGKVLLGGYLDFSTQKKNNQTKSIVNFGVNPTAGFFIADNLVIGTGIGYTHTRYPQNQIDPLTNKNTESIQKANSIKISPFGRYYVNITPQLKFFGHLEASVNWIELKSDVPDKSIDNYSNRKSNFYSASLSPGMAVFPSKRIGIELSLSGFYFAKQDWKFQDVKVNGYKNFGFGSDFFNPRLGVQFYL